MVNKLVLLVVVALAALLVAADRRGGDGPTLSIDKSTDLDTSSSDRGNRENTGGPYVGYGKGGNGDSSHSTPHGNREKREPADKEKVEEASGSSVMLRNRLQELLNPHGNREKRSPADKDKKKKKKSTKDVPEAAPAPEAEPAPAAAPAGK